MRSEMRRILRGFFIYLKFLVMSNTTYYDSTNDWFLIECKKVCISNHCYYDCIYSNGLDTMNLTQYVDKDIPTRIDYPRMKRILANDKKMQLPEYFV